ncbi:Fic family protein [Eubacterium barkeri]|uniref:Fic family protein n=1 Tax=Eubacterium barkeri TaxID=1528 RepID=A0A1H3AWK2_EUBBA|nr:Fic family protein [Eubacterium barkeri]SDX33985.1 Fic family protein [Eubacterium barkeri]
MQRLENYQSGKYRNQGDFKSFIPSGINKKWTWSDIELNYLLAQANKELGGLNTYSELIPDIDIYVRMHIRVEANKSNRIEGTRTSIQEDMMGIEEVSPEKRDDVQEVNNYINAMNHGVTRIIQDDFPFTSRLLCEMHEILLQGVRGEHKTPGEFRRSQNFIGGSMPSNAIYVPPSMVDMPELMGDLDKFMNQIEGIPELIKIAMIHYQFESIHPFLDGNGRIGRLTIPLYLLSKKELQTPCFYISDYFERNRIEYYDRLQNVRQQNDMVGWIKFFLKGAIETAQTARLKFKNAVDQVNIYQNYLLSKRTSVESQRKILEALYKNPVASVSDLCTWTQLSAQTINTTVKTLRDDGILQEVTGNKRNRIFVLKDYLMIFG